MIAASSARKAPPVVIRDDPYIRSDEDVAELVASNKRLISFAVHRWRRRFGYLEFDDMEGIAALAVFRAAKSWDPSIAKFSTYATRSIYNLLAGANAKAASRRAMDGNGNFQDKIDPDALPSSKACRSEQMERREVLDEVMHAVNMLLDPLDARIVRAKFMEELPLVEIAERFNMPLSHVMLILQRSLERIRDDFVSRGYELSPLGNIVTE